MITPAPSPLAGPATTSLHSPNRRIIAKGFGAGFI
jgi:hypothetical protein